jgi:hypothetical protein
MLVALLMQACSGVQQPPVTETLAPTSTQTAEPQTVDTGQCSNPLYPVKQGASWTYRSTGSLSGDFSFTDTITAVREDGFTLSSQVDETTLTQEWACKPEGLASLTFGSGAAGGISTSGVKMDLTSSNVQGVILPKTVNAGDQWPYSLDFEGNMEYSGICRYAGQPVSALMPSGKKAFRAAGTFTAIRSTLT